MILIRMALLAVSVCTLTLETFADQNARQPLQSAEAYYERAISEFQRNSMLQTDDMSWMFEHAISDLTKAIDLKADYAPAYEKRGEMYSRSGRYDLAIEDLSKAIGLNPQSSRAYYERGYVYSLKVDHPRHLENPASYGQKNPSSDETKEFFQKSVADLSKAIKFDPKFVGAYEARQYAHFRLGNYDQSWRDVEKIKLLGGNMNTERLRLLKEASKRQS